MSFYFNEFETIQLRGRDFLQEKARVDNGYTSHGRSLTGKVIMLIVSDTSSVQQLILQLAARGADIALVSLETSYRAARIIKEEVGKVGQRFLYVHTPLGDEQSAEHTIQTILSQFKHIDVFIDLAAKRRKPPEGATRLTTAAFLSDWNLTAAALREIAS